MIKDPIKITAFLIAICFFSVFLICCGTTQEESENTESPIFTTKIIPVTTAKKITAGSCTFESKEG